MFKRIWALILAYAVCLLPSASAFAATLGPVSSYEELFKFVFEAADGDTILISGDISADSSNPLTTPASIRLSSEGGAVIRGLHLQNASVTFADIALEDTLTVGGTSSIHLGSGVAVSGADGHTGLSFSGNGTLIIERGCRIVGGSESAGVSIQHSGGEFYGSIEGTVCGGAGANGGAGMVISPLKDSGAVMITGTIQGGSGTSLGGHALNLYDLSGNAYITVDGKLQGGSGSIGGDGIQVVSASDNVSVGISGQVKGGQGESYGGNALILMNAEDSSSVNLSGRFSGGDATGDNAQPGTSLHLVGDSASLRARIDNCILEDGKPFKPTAAPTDAATLEPTPEPTSTPEPTPEVTPLPEITAPADDPAVMITPQPTIESTVEPTPQPTIEPTSEPTAEPAIEPTAMPTSDPKVQPTEATSGEAAVQ